MKILALKTSCNSQMSCKCFVSNYYLNDVSFVQSDRKKIFFKCKIAMLPEKKIEKISITEKVKIHR